MDFFPVPQVVYHLVRSVVVNEGKGFYFFGLEDFEGALEIELGNVGNEIPIFLILPHKLILVFKVVLEDASAPDGAH